MRVSCVKVHTLKQIINKLGQFVAFLPRQTFPLIFTVPRLVRLDAGFLAHFWIS